MPDPSTTRLALYKSKSDGSELVTYSQDIGANWDKVDLAVGYQAVTSTTRPSTPYSGKSIFQTDTANSTFVHNGSAPASGGWVEIPNASSTFGSNLKLASTAQLVIGADTNLFRGAANTLRTNDAFTVDGALTASSTLAVTGNTTVGGDLKLVGGTTTHRNALAVAAGATVANTATEATIGTMTIPAADAVPGAIYRARMIANVSFLASATLTWRARIGGLAGVVIGANGPTTLSATPQTLKEVAVEVDLVCVSTGASGTWFSMLQEVRNTLGTGSVGDVQLNSTDGTIVRDTTIANDLVITAQWGAASTSNTLTGRVIFERIA